MDIAILFGQRLKEIRTQKGFSQEKLAAIAGFNRTYISKIERGERIVSIKTVASLAHALEVEVKELFDF